MVDNVTTEKVLKLHNPTLILSCTDLAINFLIITENPCALTTPTSQYRCS